MGLADRLVADGASNEPVDFQRLRFAYRRSPEQNDAPPVRRPVVVVGAGPVGLALAIDLAQKGVPVVVLDSDCALSIGSRAICFAKRTLEVFDRLGCGEPMVSKGVSWNVGKVFFRESQIYSFNLLTEGGHERPAFINLQQYYVEGFLVERAAALPLIDLRWMNSVVGVEQHTDRVVLTIDTPDGHYDLICEWVAACDGSRSTVRELIGEQSKGRMFRDRFLIADVRIKLERRCRALVLVRSKISPEPECVDAHAARRYLADRLPTRLGCRSAGRKKAAQHHSPRQGSARRQRPVRT